MNMSLLQGHLTTFKQTECEIVDHFAPGVYIRECRMPADTLVIGKTHKTKHFNQVFSGECLVAVRKEQQHLFAPSMFISNVGDKKVIYAIKDTIWLTIHPTEETDVDEIEKSIIDIQAEEQLKIDYETYLQELGWVG